MIYFRLCFSFSCSGYDLTLIKKSHTLNFYLFFLLLVNVVAQFTAKTTNSEKAIYFLSLKSHVLFTGKSFTKILYFPINVEKKYLLQQLEGGRPPPPFIYGPDITKLKKLCICWIIFLRKRLYEHDLNIHKNDLSSISRISG